MYIEAFTPVGDPADITAEICEVHESGLRAVGTISTDHEGRGKAVFTPQPQKSTLAFLQIIFIRY